MLVLPLLFATLASALPQSILRPVPETEYTILDQTLAREISSLQHILDGSRSQHIIPASLVHEISQLRQDWHIKGAAMAVVRLKDDGEWEQDTLGVGIADGAGNAVTEHGQTLFGMASNSKLFTAIAAGLIAANGTSGFTQRTKIKDVVPEWKLMDSIASDGTDLVDLLSHRTGLPRHDGSYGVAEDKNALIARMRHMRPSAEFRQSWQYNNLAYMVASTLPEHIYGISFEKFVQERIFDPLGMTQTTYSPTRANRSDAFVRKGMDVEACAEDLSGKSLSMECLGESVNIGFMREGPMNAGPGGVVSSARDMAIWLKALLMHGKSSSNQTVIPPEVLAAVATPYTLPYAPPSFTHDTDIIGPSTYGAGQIMYSYRGHYIIEHGGAVPGQMSQVMRIPGAGIGIAIMVNDNEFGTEFYQLVQRRILGHILGLEPIDWATKIKAKMIEKLRKSLPPSRPGNATVDVDLSSIPGTYTDAAYGEMTICALDEKTQACATTLAGNPFPAQPADIPTFIAYFPKFWSDYLLFTHRNGSTFTVTQSATYTETNVTVPSPFESFDAVFHREGMAWTRGAWGAGPGVEDQSIEVWFEKK